MSSTLKIDLQTQSHDSESMVSAFGKVISGTVIDYHSHHPIAEKGLLVRANASCNKIAWQTAMIPKSDQENQTLLLCIAIAGSKGGGHSFSIIMDGSNVGRIVSAGEDDFPKCISEASAAVEFRFEAKMQDQFGDHFGLLYISINSDRIKQRQILDFEIIAEDDDSEDWLIVYGYDFAFVPKVVAEPILKDTVLGRGQILRVVYDHHQAGTSIKMQSALEAVNIVDPDSGANVLRIAIPALSEAGQVQIESYINGQIMERQALALHPVVPRTVYILPFSHNDIGYTDQQERVRLRQHQNIDKALAMAEKTKDRDSHAQARWNLEVLWALQSWWQEASEDDRGKFIEAVKSGHIGLNALHNNLLSGLCNTEELNHHLDFARSFTAETGIPINSAAITDIPGFVWSIVDALANAGVKYFAIAPNSGDRVGHIYALADQPFYWSNPRGDAKILTWIMGAGYAMFHRESISQTGIKKALQYLRMLQGQDYPYPIIPLAYTIGGDNGMPDEALADFVETWNRQYCSPHFVIATHEQFFADFETKHGESLPTRKGDMTPYWEDGAASTALETKLSRNAADRLVWVEKLYTRYFPDLLPRAELAAAWDKVVFFDEHTWGAWNSVSEPDTDFVIKQWQYKQGFAREADIRSKALLIDLQSLGISERWTDGYADDYFAIDSCSNPQAVDTMRSSSRYENSWIMIDLDIPRCTVSKMVLKASGISLCSADLGFFQYLYMQGVERDKLISIKDGRIVDLISGSGYVDIIMGGTAFACDSYFLSLRVWDEPARMEVALCMDKLAIRSKESVHLAFPFELEDAKLYYDGAGTWIDPQVDLLPVACRNFFCPQRRVQIRNPQICITITLRDNPLIEIGAITAEEPWLRETAEGTRFFAYLMNNYWHTNYKAEQSGKICFRFGIEFMPCLT